ncbi:hypothetical protein HMN09_01257400 [Mycena chlorophos]|uniref:Fungal-type protein kinase domain-containing protein n=1 Tax=Mycena chlorophos TaxID=658473 RepID=A0A8H6VTS6_MYCCL|nr:hypothetical protein HMN09_01257400 [Mycena chlorophos]
MAVSHDTEGPYRALKAAVELELADAWAEEDPETLPLQRNVEHLFTSHPVHDTDIDAWLKEYDGYDYKAKRWIRIPDAVVEADDLYEPMVNIMRDIVSQFQQRENIVDGKVVQRRAVLDTHDTANPLKSLPGISIIASGGGCATNDPDIPAVVTYAQISDIYEGKLDADFRASERSQLGVYAREIFVQQPTRRFVRATLFTDAVVRVLHFDRGGCFYSQLIDYHDKALFFVKLVLLGTSFNETHFGRDTTVEWNGKRRSIRVVGDDGGGDCQFDVEPEPLFFRRTIRSRGTVCWRGWFNGGVYIIKDYWRAEGRVKESHILRDLLGVRGVGQMLAFEDDRTTVENLRGLSMLSEPLVNRIQTRIVVREYGETLEKAGCAHQLLRAVRDIVVAHRHCTLRLPEDKRVLHGDISLHNLRLADGAEGVYGVMIDWDLAKRMVDVVGGKITSSDLRAGTLAYQSIRVHLGDVPGLPHLRPVDDLESTLYVLIDILFGFDHNGVRLTKLPPTLEMWLKSPNPNPAHLADSKRSILSGSRIRFKLTRFLCEREVTTFHALISTLSRVVKRRVDAVLDAIVEDAPIPHPEYTVEEAEEDYTAFLDALEEAMKELEDGGLAGPYRGIRVAEVSE